MRRMAMGQREMRRAFEPIAVGVGMGAVVSVWLASYIRALLFGVKAGTCPSATGYDDFEVTQIFVTLKP